MQHPKVKMNYRNDFGNMYLVCNPKEIGPKRLVAEAMISLSSVINSLDKLLSQFWTILKSYRNIKISPMQVFKL
jgi:hypothetical protein